MTRTLILQVPKQHDFSNPAVELNPKRLGSWLTELPLLNLSLSAKSLLDALMPTNLQPMPAKTRMRLLELYRQTIVAIFDALDEEALRSQPISPAQRALAREHGAALCRELANGYKLLVRELHGQDPKRQPLWHPALYRAMEAAALTLLDCYRSYQVPPSFAYLELHQLHVLAEDSGLLDAPVQLEKQRLSETGIGSLYQRILMLSVTDPYHLPAGTAVKLFAMLEPLAPHARIQPYQDNGPAGCYVVERGGDSPPIPCARAQSDYELEQPVLLDLRPALKAAAQTLAQMRAGNEGDDERMRLLAILAPQLEAPRQRQAPRRDTRRQAWISFGIDAIHHYTSHGARYIAKSIAESQADIQVRDLAHEDEQSYVLDAWQIVNESVTGYLLSSAGQWHGEAPVGNLVAVVTPSRDPNEPRLAVAVVRWMRAGRNQTVEMGIELLPGNVRAVHCERDQQSGPALLFSSVPALRLPATVVTAKGLYQPGANLRIRTGNRSSTIRAGQCLKETPHLDQFDFEAAQ